MKDVKYNTKAFKNMENLRILEIDEVHLDGKFKHLSSSKVLRCLRWNHCPLKSINISSSGTFEKLVSLEIENSNIKEFKAPLKLRSLQDLNLWGSLELKASPEIFGNLTSLQSLSLDRTSIYGVLSNLSHLFNLKIIWLNLCKNQEVLQQLPHTVEEVNLYHCDNLKMIQEFPLNLRSIFLHNCRSLKMLPILPPNLEQIHLDCCENLEMLPKLPLNLEGISLSSCKNIKMLTEFPPNLRDIFLGGCEKFEMLPELPPNLFEIMLDDWKNLKILPELPLNLYEIILSGCRNLKMLPKFPPNVTKMNFKILGLIEKVSNLSNYTRLCHLHLSGCKKLKDFPNWENLHSIWTMR
nr:TMV resistance protein N-like isoform X1 [Ipomoea batatas]